MSVAVEPVGKWDSWRADGTIDANDFELLTTTDTFDHCVFTVRKDFPEESEQRWLDVLFSMTYDNPEHQKMMDLEGLKEWKPGRTSGFGPRSDAVARQRFFE